MADGGQGDLFRTRPAPNGSGLEVVFYDVRTREERPLGIVDGYAQAQSFISGAIAAIEASGVTVVADRVLDGLQFGSVPGVAGSPPN